MSAARIAIMLPTLLAVVFSLTASGTAAGYINAVENNNTTQRNRLWTATLIIGTLALGAFSIVFAFQALKDM